MTKIYLFILLTGIGILHASCSKSSSLSNKSQESYDTVANLPQLTVFGAPTGAPKNNTFSVYVKYEGGQWIDLFAYDAEVDGGNQPSPKYHMAFVSFDADFSKKIEVKVHKNDGPMSNVKIRPGGAGIAPTIVDANTITFTLTGPQKLSVEVNNDLHNNLMVFANKPEENPVTAAAPNVYYFGAGIHKIGTDGQGTLVLKDNDKVYIAGGAIVYGSISASGANNISVTGRGILCGSMFPDHAYPHTIGRRLIQIDKSDKIRIEGITLLNSVSWNVSVSNSTNLVCRNLKVMGWTINSDGIDPTSSSNVLIDDCFIRNYDDCVSVKLSYGGAASPTARDSRNVTVQNCILWTDQGRALGFGPESYSSQNRVYDSIMVKNIDILYNQNYNVDWAKGAISILLGDDATMQNVTFEDIRVDKLGTKTNLVTLTILQTPYNISVGKRLQNVNFNRISLNSALNIDNTIRGYDASRIIDGVHFTDLKINNSNIKDATSGKFNINNYAQNITFN